MNYSEQHLDQFSCFRTVRGTESLQFTMGHPFPPQSCPYAYMIWTAPIYYMVSWTNRNLQPKWHLDQFSHFCRVHDHDRQNHRPTDHATSVTICHIHIHSTAMWPNNILKALTIHRQIKTTQASCIKISVVTVAEICNSVGGGVLFDTPPSCRWRWRMSAVCTALGVRFNHLSRSLPLTPHHTAHVNRHRRR